jgi:uncharacterized protein (TIGR02996 family)
MPRWEKERGGLDIFELEERSDGGADLRSGRVDATGAVMEPWRPLKRGLTLSYQRAVERIIEQRETIGYRRVDDKPLGIACNPALEAAILDNPSFDEPYEVYADWLLEHGDARGEWAIAERENDTYTTARLASQAERRLRADLGEPTSCVHYRGLLRELTVTPASLARVDGHALCTVLDTLRVGLSPSEALGKSLFGRTLPHLPIRTLIVERLEEDVPTSWVEVIGLDKAWPKLPRLRELIIDAGTIETASFPPLEKLELRTTGLAPNTFEAATAPSTTLHSLVLWLGSHIHGLCELLGEAPRWPSLGTLGLCNLALDARALEKLFEALAKSPILPQLKRLDLSRSGIFDRDLVPLVVHHTAFAHLELDLSECLLTPAGIVAAHGIARRVITERQRRDQNGERYASVTE